MNKQRSNTEPGSDLISRQAAVDLVTNMEFMNNTAKGILRDRLRKLPSAQPEPLTVTIDYEPSKDECDRLKQAMRDAPILLLPSAQPEPRWIPVSERLPEDDDIVLITMDDSITVRGEFFEQISNELGFFRDGAWHWGYEIGECYWPETTHVTAWMPLPKPYKEGNE